VARRHVGLHQRQDRGNLGENAEMRVSTPARPLQVAATHQLICTIYIQLSLAEYWHNADL
jgi:hypothetical protein